ncbi:hypothetical protein JM946_15915 [Steroidobacter sp. S1-65]|uniref:SGNH/GDSL hydrolase family protein n=1 Tax=Steroidobacter gossypii TaxID=2805490 RepID=A0ABS1WZ14_9GAMM|nr:hypothetical protein [Steroidobacter gossypii]MBM0106219.1 hypothetical protein [Steroidobacter gossypii]
MAPSHSSAAPLRPFGVLFGHQSVGANIVTGLTELTHTQPLAGPRICDAHHMALDGKSSDSRWRLFHCPVGRNREPVSKLQEFERLIGEKFASEVDVALLKFCYVDVTIETAIEDLFQTYMTRMTALARSLPQIRFAHCTVPLRAVQPVWRATLGRMLGRSDPEVEHNRAREAFNQRLRDAVPAATLFDLAALESGSPAGQTAAAGRALRGDWTNDGGHLNARGRKIVARAFVQFLESLRTPVS